MEKNEFLASLENNLTLLDEIIVDDIIEYYSSIFVYEKKFNNKNNQEVLESLGNPEDIAKSIYINYEIKEEKWSSTRDVKINNKKIITVVLLDVFLFSWLIPFVVFITLATLAIFITFPVALSVLAGLNFKDALLMVFFIIGSYSTIAVLVIAITELSLVVIKKVIYLNVMSFTPHLHTTGRMIKKLSLMKIMNNAKICKNVLINIFMIALFVSSTTFLVINDKYGNFFSVFTADIMMEEEIVRDLSNEIEILDQYYIDLDFGDLDLIITTNNTTDLKITHLYNLEDSFESIIDIDNNTIFISTNQANVRNTLLSKYKGKIVLSIPDSLLTSKINLKIGDGQVFINDFALEELAINIDAGELAVYDIDTVNFDLNLKKGKVNLLNSNILHGDLLITDGKVNLFDINSAIHDGNYLKVITALGSLKLNNVYTESIDLSSVDASIDFKNENTFYIIDNLVTTSTTGTINLNVKVKE